MLDRRNIKCKGIVGGFYLEYLNRINEINMVDVEVVKKIVLIIIERNYVYD